jgi:integrase/recombinase XerD
MSSSSAAPLTDWLNTVLDGKSPRTREGYVYVVKRLFAYLESESHPIDLALLRPMHLRGFFADCRQEGLTANSLANFDRTLRAIFARVDREGREDFDLPAAWKNPLASVEKLRPQQVQKLPLSADQAQQLLRTCPRTGFLAYRNYAELAFMLMTGARSIEVVNVRVNDLNLEQRLVDLRITKGGKPRIVFLPTRLVRILSNYLRRRERRVPPGTEWVFPTRDGGVQSRRSLHRSVRRAGQRIGLTDLGPHRLRHSYVTLSHANGAPLRFLQEQCGHSSVLVTQGYITLSEQQKSALADRFSSV